MAHLLSNGASEEAATVENLFALVIPHMREATIGGASRPHAQTISRTRLPMSDRRLSERYEVNLALFRVRQRNMFMFKIIKKFNAELKKARPRA